MCCAAGRAAQELAKEVAPFLVYGVGVLLELLEEIAYIVGVDPELGSDNLVYLIPARLTTDAHTPSNTLYSLN
jgi:hypothetical protein